MDAGALLLREVDIHRGWTDKLADCFSDGRNPLLIEHQLKELLRQFVYGLAMGYEDCNDHDELRHDPLFFWGGCSAERANPTGGTAVVSKIAAKQQPVRVRLIGFI